MGGERTIEVSPEAVMAELKNRAYTLQDNRMTVAKTINDMLDKMEKIWGKPQDSQ